MFSYAGVEICTIPLFCISKMTDVTCQLLCTSTMKVIIKITCHLGVFSSEIYTFFCKNYLQINELIIVTIIVFLLILLLDQPFLYLLVLDFESTCWKDCKYKTQEISRYIVIVFLWV